MAVEENNITKRIQKATSRIGTRLFRQNVGKVWTGKVIRGEGLMITLGPSDIVLRHGRPVEMGLIKGSSDLIGWHPVQITADMVGRTVAVFTAMEVKTQHGIASPEQKNFCQVICDAGGIAGVMRSDDEALALLAGFGTMGETK